MSKPELSFSVWLWCYFFIWSPRRITNWIPFVKVRHGKGWIKIQLSLKFSQGDKCCLSLIAGIWSIHSFLSIIFTKIKNNFNWSIVDLQCCVNFCCTAKRLSFIYVYILFNILFHMVYRRMLNIVPFALASSLRIFFLSRAWGKDFYVCMTELLIDRVHEWLFWSENNLILEPQNHPQMSH